jgi:hypothetical protein
MKCNSKGKAAAWDRTKGCCAYCGLVLNPWRKCWQAEVNGEAMFVCSRCGVGIRKGPEHLKNILYPGYPEEVLDRMEKDGFGAVVDSIRKMSSKVEFFFAKEQV